MNSQIAKFVLLAASGTLVFLSGDCCVSQESGSELERLKVRPQPWLTNDVLAPRGTRYETEVPATLDLAERARAAVQGLTNFLDTRHHEGSFGHGLFSTRPAVMVHDGGMAQNWGKIADATVLARTMCGSRVNLAQQRASFEALLTYAEWKRPEPYPVPLARIAMTLDSLIRQEPHANLQQRYREYANWLQQQMQVDRDAGQVFFGSEERRWQRDDADHPMGPIGYSLQMFTGGTVLRTLVRYEQSSGLLTSPERLAMLADYLRDDRFWQPESHPAMVVPAEQGQFWGHHHSYTQALLGLLYWAHHVNDIETLEFVRRSYEYLRTFGIAEIGLFGEGCTTADMTYLAVRLSQWRVGDYWDDVDRYTRNQLTELQILDAEQLHEIVDRHVRPLDVVELGDWAHLPNTERVIERSRGLFWSDCSHPTCIQLRSEHPPHATRLQWVVCCSGNCTKAMFEVWDAVVENKPDEILRVNLLLNRASPWLDVESHLPHEGRVILRFKCDSDVAVRFPSWVVREKVACRRPSDEMPPPRWLGNYLLLSGCRQGETVTLSFPMAERTETTRLAWQPDQFWQESTKPPSYWPEQPAQEYKLTFRGNTLADIQPRSSAIGYQLYVDRSLGALRLPANRQKVERFVCTKPNDTVTE